MNIIQTDIEGVLIIEPRLFKDERGYFFESFSQRDFNKQVRVINFVQDNESMSSYGVMRGLHFQRPPFCQSKLVRCVKGAVLDVAVDIRKGSPTFGKHVAVELTEDNHRQFFIPVASRMASPSSLRRLYFNISAITFIIRKLMAVSAFLMIALVSIGRSQLSMPSSQRRIRSTIC